MKVNRLFLIYSTNISSPINSSFIVEKMPKNLYIPCDESNLISPTKRIRFWEKGEMAYTALKKINQLKANNESKKAEIILAEWIF